MHHAMHGWTPRSCTLFGKLALHSSGKAWVGNTQQSLAVSLALDGWPHSVRQGMEQHWMLCMQQQVLCW